VSFEPVRFVGTSVTLQLLLIVAYDLPPRLERVMIEGGPPWIDTDGFDVLAKAEGVVEQPQMQSMLRALLADRFKLRAQMAQRQRPIYALVRTGTASPGLRPSEGCVPFGGRGTPDGGAEPRRTLPDGRPLPPCAGASGRGRVSDRSLTMTQLVTRLGPYVDRIVVDRTGLTGTFDIELLFTPDRGLGGPGLPPGAPGRAPAPADGPSLFTALVEQLGLKLEPQTGAVDVLVVDHAEPPAEN
jgi:uncharacterized protein (TIGR03435 family)